jgi:hypothetical protein
MVGCGMLKCKKSEQDLINEAIERDIKQQQREAHRIYKILLLGKNNNRSPTMPPKAKLKTGFSMIRALARINALKYTRTHIRSHSHTLAYLHAACYFK